MSTQAPALVRASLEIFCHAAKALGLEVPPALTGQIMS
jgi:hypothetical protein